MPKLPALRTRSYFRLWNFQDEILVECPACGECARATEPAYDRSSTKYRMHISCLHCASQRDLDIGYRYDDVPLWLKTPCCGNLLWALNARHLTALEAFVGAGLRDTRVGPLRDSPAYGVGGAPSTKQKADVNGTENSWQRMNSHMYSRLPAWMMSAKNRPDVLRGLRKLRTKLGKTSLS
jgi:hypothetical protein